MSLGVKLDQVRGPGPPGDRLARVTFRGNQQSIHTILLLIFITLSMSKLRNPSFEKISKSL